MSERNGDDIDRPPARIRIRTWSWPGDVGDHKTITSAEARASADYEIQRRALLVSPKPDGASKVGGR